MLIKKHTDIKSSEIISESAYLNRRQLIKKMLKLGLVGGAAMQSQTQAGLFDRIFGDDKKKQRILKPLKFTKANKYLTNEQQTVEGVATAYNNFYEFSFDKEEPAEISQSFKTDPWSLEVSGEADVTGKFNLEDILSRHPLEERIYRMRCVERWSMVIPWLGFSLSDLLKSFKPNSNAKYVEFTTLEDPEQFPAQKDSDFGLSSLDWPYIEGLRIDEAMHPLAFMVTGMYGKELPPQNGAPLRLIVPWKYGFKGIKSIVKINFTDTVPWNTWQVTAPREYGFYANVNPAVAHPRWSQAFERRLTSGALSGIKRIETKPFNGYADQVASLYTGMDLSKQF